MITCGKCGNTNPLGRVFCGACGSKLNLSQMTTEHVSEITRRRGISLKWLYALWAIPALILFLVALAFWPDKSPIGKKGTRVGAQRTAGTIRALMDLKQGRTLGRSISEEDINGYFEFEKAPAMGLESVSVKALEGYFQVRVVRLLQRIEVASLVIEPRLSYDLHCIPAGAGVRVVRLRMGHLGWLGPMRISVIRSVYGLFAGQKEWAVFEDLSEVTCEEGKISIAIRKE